METNSAMLSLPTNTSALSAENIPSNQRKRGARNRRSRASSKLAPSAQPAEESQTSLAQVSFPDVVQSKHNHESLPQNDHRQHSSKDSSRARKRRSGANGRQTKRSENNTPQSSVSGWCSICSIDLVERRYLAVGYCNHTVCSICALRLRAKCGDRSCAICRSSLAVMIVYDSQNACEQLKSIASRNAEDCNEAEIRTLSDGTVPCEAFPIDHSALQCSESEGASEERALAAVVIQANQNFRNMINSGNSYGSKVSHEADGGKGAFNFDAKGGVGLIFFNCHQHYLMLQDLRAFTCPICQRALKGHRSRKFPSAAALLRHISEAHSCRRPQLKQARKASPGGAELTVCSLCLEHRPLFTAELPTYTSTQLQAHIRGEDEGETSSSGGAAVDAHTAGHPECKFCRENFFDQHMVRAKLRCVCSASFLLCIVVVFVVVAVVFWILSFAILLPSGNSP